MLYQRRLLVEVFCFVGLLGLLTGCQLSVTLPPSGSDCQSSGSCGPSGRANPSNPTEPTDPPKKACVEGTGSVCPKDLCQEDKDCSAGQRCTSTSEGKRCTGSVDCSKLSVSDCWKSRPLCVVEYVSENKYACRAPRNDCEKQLDMKSCEASSGCGYDPGQCFCPPDPLMDCVCGGGPPPMCRLASELCKGEADCALFCMNRYQCCAESSNVCIDSLMSCSSLNRPLPDICTKAVDCKALDVSACKNDPRCALATLPEDPTPPHACVSVP
ncbi:MAG: hypothetical protein H6728_13690 [Myxococcales bacterium]|nr:hypothetical protein [Myxococcales bacterium]